MSAVDQKTQETDDPTTEEEEEEEEEEDEEEEDEEEEKLTATESSRSYRQRLKRRSASELLAVLSKLPATKTCLRCKRSLKRVIDFAKKSDLLDGRKRECRDCVKQQMSDKLKRLRAYQLTLKMLGCMKCGWKGHPEALDFAHDNSQNKKRNRRGRTVNPTKFRSLSEFKKEEKHFRVLCAICHEVETDAYRQESKLSFTNKSTLLQRNMRQRVDIVAAEKKKRGFCVDCRCAIGSLPDSCFDFDHLPKEEKRETISQMVCNPSKFSTDDIRKEMLKCELVCKRCHRVRTVTRRNNSPESIQLAGTILNAIPTPKRG